MKTEINIPDEIRSNRVEDLFRPCWIVKALRSDRVESSNEQGWIALAVFEDSREMLAMIGDWGKPAAKAERDAVSRTNTMGGAR